MRLYANHGGLHRHAMEGINSRMDPLQAAVLSVKCKHLFRWTEERIAHAHQYLSLLSEIPEIIPPEIRSGTRHTFHQFVIRTKRRDELHSFLSRNGVQTLIHYPVSLPNLPAYARFGLKPSDFPEATKCQNEVLSLPIYPELKEEQIASVAEKMKNFFKRA
jgi:dTDP-4-amino-4,6-dideoxygalactose transaminase